MAVSPCCVRSRGSSGKSRSMPALNSVVAGKIMEKDQYSYGFDAQTGEYGNLVTKGIIDPTKVVRCAIQGAASVAGLLITTEAMVAELRFARSASRPTARCRITNITLSDSAS